MFERVPKRIVAAFVLAWALPAAGHPAAIAASPKVDRECLLEAMRTHPVKGEAYWRDVLSRPVADRLGPAPAALVEFLHLDNAANGFPEKPRASRTSAEFMADMRGAIEDLPPAVRRAFDATFAGVWLVDDLGGTGFMDLFVDAGDRPVGGYIVLDAAVLGKRIKRQNNPLHSGGFTGYGDEDRDGYD